MPISILKKINRNHSRGILQRLRNNQSGTVLIEFAFAMPIFMGLGMYGSETSMVAITNTRISQAALNLADNASRLGQTDTGVITPTITESDIINVLKGTEIQSKGLKLFENGRVIISSLEVTSSGQQFIRWRRCKGMRDIDSNYDDDKNNDNITDPAFIGMGQEDEEAKAVGNSAVMFVEVEYVYQPLFGNLFMQKPILRQEAAFNIRDQRNLPAGLFNDLRPVSDAATCNKLDMTLKSDFPPS